MFEGNRAGFDQLRPILVVFTSHFEITPGTAPKKPTLPPKSFEVRGLINEDDGCQNFQEGGGTAAFLRINTAA